MKKIIGSFIITLFAVSVNAQLLSVANFSSDNHSSNWISKRTIGWILTGGGVAVVVGGIIVHNSNQSFVPNEKIGTIMMIGGGAAAVTGIILISSSDRKNQARTASLELNVERAIVINQNAFENNYFPALTYKVHIGKK